jgi:hypothetical protein
MSISSFIAIRLGHKLSQIAQFQHDNVALAAGFEALKDNQEFLEFIGQTYMPGYLKTPSESAHARQVEILNSIVSLMKMRDEVGETEEFIAAQKAFRERVQALKFDVASDISVFNPIGSLTNMGSLRCGDVPTWVHLILWPGIALFVILYSVFYR